MLAPNLAKNIPLPKNDTTIYDYLKEIIKHTMFLSKMNALYNLFFFAQARFKPLVNQVFYFLSFFGELLLLDSVC